MKKADCKDTNLMAAKVVATRYEKETRRNSRIHISKAFKRN